MLILTLTTKGIMKRYYFVLFLTLLCFSVHAQKSKNNCSEEEFKAKKQAYIAEQAGHIALLGENMPPNHGPVT